MMPVSYLVAKPGAPQACAWRRGVDSVCCALRLLFAVCLSLAATTLIAAPINEFEISDIRINGLQRLAPVSVFGLLPVTAGDLVDKTTIRELIRLMFVSGYFNDITVARDGTDLVIDVVENPSIETLEITGNKAISTDNLREGLASAGLAENEVFQYSTLAGVESELQRLYIAQGRYNAEINATATALPLNKAAIDIAIIEGNVSRIAHINLVGNHTFSDKELLDLFELQAPPYANAFNRADRYSREKLQGDLERLESYCQDRGYVGFRILSTQVSITPDKKKVYITINVDEGKQYRVSDVQIVGEIGDVPLQSLQQLLVVETDVVFSRALITASEDNLIDALSDAGYSLATVTGTPELDEDTDTVTIKLFVDIGERTYVRRINFHGNTITRDQVLRREMVQLEGGWASSSQMNLSKLRLERLGLFSEVSLETTPVPNTDEGEIDVDVTVEEQPSGSISASIGYASSQGTILSGTLRDNNLFGSGNNLDVTINRSDYRSTISLSYLNPYVTEGGASRGYNIYTVQTDYEERNIASYTTETIGGGVNYGFPIRQNERLRFNLALDDTQVQLGVNPEQEYEEFFEREGRRHLNYKITTNWNANALNRGLFPTAGWSQNLGFELSLPVSDLRFYKFIYSGQTYIPLNKKRDTSLRFRTRVGYGGVYGSTGLLPFYENFFAGGFGSVRGFKSYSLGSRSTPSASLSNARGDPFGGNLLIEGSMELILKLPFAEGARSVRPVLFFDIGQVFNTNCPSVSTECFDFDADRFKYSVGFAITWLSPLGPLNFSYAVPFNVKGEDQEEAFQFEIGGRLY